MFQAAFELNDICKNHEELDHALVMRLKALEINKRLGSQTGMADDCHRLGILYALRGQLRSSTRLLQRALTLERGFDRPGPLSDCCYNLAAVHAAQGHSDIACQFYKETLSIDQQLGNLSAQMHCHLALVQIYLELGDNPEAKPHLNTALDLLQRSRENQPEVAGVLTSIARSLLRTFQAVPALEALTQARNICERCNQPFELAEITALTGAGYHLAGNRDMAERSLREAIERSQSLDRKIQQADSCANLANLYWATNRKTAAGRLYQQALALFKEVQHQPEARRVEQLLSDLSALEPAAV